MESHLVDTFIYCRKMFLHPPAPQVSFHTKNTPFCSKGSSYGHTQLKYNKKTIHYS